MSVLRRAGLDRAAWALRRFHAPLGSEALVLEVGSGGNPYPRANVLLDAYEATRERHWARLTTDRPTVLGFGERLPFRDQAFDFVIAAHVLEHSSQPERFLAELQRVAKAGYIEVPDAFMERVNPYKDHRLEVTCRDGCLLIRKKAAWQQDPELVDLYESRAKRVVAGDLIPRHPFEFHVRYYWEGRIDYRVLNPEVDASWSPPPSGPPSPPPRPSLRELVRDALRGLLSQSQRNSSLDVLKLLRCMACSGGPLARGAGALVCAGCGKRFPVRGEVLAMNEGY